MSLPPIPCPGCSPGRGKFQRKCGRMTAVREKELAALLSELVDLRANLNDRIEEEAECPGESGFYGRDGIAYFDKMKYASEFLRIAQDCLSALVESFGLGDSNDGD